MDLGEKIKSRSVEFYGGLGGALFPFIIFLIGVVSIALSGAPDERGFWPILLLSLSLGLLLSKDKNEFCQSVLDGMSQRIVMIMIMAWILASSIGILMSITGFVEALTWLASLFTLGSTGFIIATFMICCLVSLSTGSSFATILICSPLLYPSGGMLGAHLPTLAGAIIGGATFGDFIAPISDTTIASALSQKASIGPTVKSRVKYILPATIFALVLYWISATYSADVIQQVNTEDLEGSPRGLPMALVPILIIYLFLKGKHLIYGLLSGLVFGVVLGLAFGLLPPDQLLSLDLENMTAKSFVIDGINRAVGLSFFTILLMGLVSTLTASGLIDNLVNYASRHITTVRHAELWISGTVGAAVLLTTHSIVAILMVDAFSNKTGEEMGIKPKRRANILSLVVCVFPFILPYFIPVILMSSMTMSGEEFGVSSVSPIQVGLYNFVGWGLMIMVVFVVFFGYGRKADSIISTE